MKNTNMDRNKGSYKMDSFDIDKENNIVKLIINPSVFPIDIVMSASYIFTTDYYVMIDKDDDDKIIVEIKPKSKNSISLQDAGREFNNELINYTNYAIQTIKNSKIKEAYLQRVLLTNTIESNIKNNVWDDGFNKNTLECDDKELFDDIEGSDEIFSDPEGIATPWNEKYDEEDKNR